MSPSSSIYLDRDISLEPLKNKIVGIIGYGNQARAQALNLRDSGIELIIGLREGSASRAKAGNDGFAVSSIDDCARRSDIVAFLVPDETHRELYEKAVAPCLNQGKAVIFAHGLSVASGEISLSDGIDVVLIAPCAPGTAVRENFVRGGGVPGLFAVHRDATGKAREIALAYGKGIGCGRCCLIETTFEEEMVTDLFGEQAVVCGGVSSLIRTAFETLVENGYSPEIAYIECLHQLKLTVDLIHAGGISGMREKISSVALYGDLTKGPELIGDSVKQTMKNMILEIKSGKFAREWRKDVDAGGPVVKNLKRNAGKHDIEIVGSRLRNILSGQKPGGESVPGGEKKLDNLRKVD